MNRLFKFIFLIALLALGTFFLMKAFPDTLNNDNNRLNLITTLTILCVYIFRVSSSNISFISFIKQISSWIIILLLIVVGYSYKNDLNKIYQTTLANLIPGYGQKQDANSMVFYAADNNHFIISALVNDSAQITFLVDTGATNVSLTYSDAIKLGINVEELRFTTPVNTANGRTFSAPCRLDKIQIGDIIIYDVSASVSKDGISDISLLGMSFLNKLSSFQIDANKLTIRN